jgi:quercetin dioxygenase-like cupin family protein
MGVLNEHGSLPLLQVWEGVTVRIVRGEQMTMAIAELAPGITVPQHQHPNEQLGVVLEGSARFITDEETSELRAGGTYRLLADVPHQVEVGPEGAVFMECFAPPRVDWDALQPAADGSVRWPTAR